MIQTIVTSVAVLLRIVSNPLANVFQKQLAIKGNHPLLINFLTYFLLAIFCIFIAVRVQWYNFPLQFWFYSILGGITGALGNGFLVKALEKGELSVLGPINSYKSVIGMVAGIFLLGEIPNLWGLTGIALIVYGSYFVLETTESRFSWVLFQKPEIQFRLWALILTAIEAVFIKKIILYSSATVAFISWCWFGAIFSFLFPVLSGLNLKAGIKNVALKDISGYIYLVICIGIMQFTTSYTLAHMPVGYALSLFQLSIIISVLLGRKFFNESDIKKKLIGSAIMILGSVVIIFLKDA